jgi:hypothetical protein
VIELPFSISACAGFGLVCQDRARPGCCGCLSPASMER